MIKEDFPLSNNVDRKSLDVMLLALQKPDMSWLLLEFVCLFGISDRFLL